MTVFWFAFALTLVQEQTPSSVPSTLRIVTPLDTSDAEQLDAFFQQHERELGAKASVARVVEISARELEPDTLLLAYERGLLDELAHGVGGVTVVPFARQSWAPAWRVGAAMRGEIDSFASLLGDEWRGHVVVRRVTADSSEGLVLGELARRLGKTGPDELPHFVLGSDREETLAPSTQSFDRLLAALPAGFATIVPVRSAARARRAGLSTSWTQPREGFLTLELAAALTKGSSSPVVEWFTRRFESDVAPRIGRELELEPLGAPPPDAPKWMELTAKASAPIDRAAADAVRLRLVPLYVSPLGVAPTPYDRGVPAWIDATLLTIAAFVALVAWRKVGRDRRRDRGA